ncbi:MAG: type VI secretion system baseplate subunit TssE [Pseudomonadota bacterium]
MAELTTQERLQPSLLDRLLDEAPAEQRESRDKRVVSVQQLRAGVIRDLGWLLNTSNLASCVDLDPYPAVIDSVLNFGIPDLAGRTASGVDVSEIEDLMLHAITTFEPRLIAETVKVRLQVSEGTMSINTMRFDIEAELWAQPISQRIYLQTELDLELGSVRVREVSR